MSSKKQYIGRSLWLLAILAALFCYLYFPNFFSAQGLTEYIRSYNSLALWIYLTISVLRGFFLIPSTPFILAGVGLFPNALTWVFIISMIGVLFGSSVVYLFSERLGFGETLCSKHERLYLLLQEKMQVHGFPIVILWSFFPAVPTDLICCVAGTIRMPFWKFFLAVFLGECVLVLGYIYTGKALFSWLFAL